MDLGLRDRTALVCAASEGLGKATAIGFATEGANVVICSRDKAKLDAAAAEISRAAEGGSVLAVQADVTKAADITRLVDTAATKFGRIDALVTNAGGPPVGDFLDLDDEQWERGITLNLMSTVRLIRAVVPYMKARKWGRIVNITSIAAKQPITDLIISSSVRPGILGLSKVLSQQLGADGILINTVAPGFFLTARQKEISASRASSRGISLDEYVAELGKTTPLGRIGEPRELADVIVFLCSERSSYISGTVLSVDGGATKGIL
jgi:3-oxoacyl-[acyl-carrier protein] reductase